MNQSAAAQVRAANEALLTHGDLDAVGDFFAPGYVAHLSGRDMTGGPGAVRSFLGALRRAFRDFRVDVEILAEGKDRIAWQRTIRATHEGPFKGFPASGLELVWRDMVVSRFEDGLIAEEWVVTDHAEQLLLARKR
ncbi:MAG: ester cyclase [Gemmatimonadota bacterium]|jgi:steroid delta-isomerase-like uncharacterized protein